MTGIQAVIDIPEGYPLLVLGIILGFAIYDIKTKRAPDKALALFAPAALAAPFIHAAGQYGGAVSQRLLALVLLRSLAGAAAGFAILLAAALTSKDGQGVGGGDVKFAAILGFIYGPYDIVGVLLVASLLALLVGWVVRKRSGGLALRLPFIPFIAAGCLIATILRLFD